MSNSNESDTQEQELPEITVEITCADPEIIMAELADHSEVIDFELIDQNHVAEKF